jgi:ligand-binding sensor domain-containing protein/signal transduction histidine kinase
LPAIKVTYVLWLALLFKVHLVSGQSFYFRHYSVENGLSNNAVLCSVQDKMGFLWFGTKDGLNRFDGYTFKTFRKAAGKRGAIGHNFIRSLYNDAEGTLWVGTEKGLYKYLERTEEFILLPGTANHSVRNLVQDKHGDCWFISGFALCRYIKRTGKLEKYNHRKYFIATALCTTPQGAIWIGTVDGHLKKYNAENNSFADLDLFQHSKPAADKYIECLYYSSDGQLMAGTHTLGIKILNSQRNDYTDIVQPFSVEKKMFVRTIMQTTADEFWLGTETGIFIYNRKTGQAIHLQKDYNDPFSIADNIVHTFCRDKEGGIWIGSYFGGVNYYPDQYTPFKKFFPKKGENSISGNVTREIKKDQYGNLWIGTEDAGLNKLDPSGRFTHYKPTAGSSSISAVNIHGLLATGNELWIGTFDQGIDVMDIRTGKVFRRFRAGPGSVLPINFIYSIYQTGEGRILIGTPLGIFTYNRIKDKLERFEGLPHWAWYSSILMDRSGTIWAATLGAGVHYYNPATGKGGSFKYDDTNANSLSSDRVNAVFEDSKGNLWLATEEGLCKWDPSTQNFTHYGAANGFPSDFMLSILEDEMENLWVTTTKGLVRFQPVSGKLQVFTTVNGLLSDQFNFNSACKDTNGVMYFGSVKGLVGFRPAAFRQNSFPPPVFITGIQINDRDLPIGQKGSPLTQSITLTDKITLAHNQSTIAVNFAALSYTAPEMMQYSYKMEGLSKEWVNLKTSRRVSFTELPPGNYTFLVRAMNNDGVWDQKETKLSVQILPPWWATSWAYSCYALLVVLLVYYMAYLYHKRLKEKNRRKIELVEMEKEKAILQLELAKEKEIVQAKIDFFTNVSHEIRTPLTLISVPLAKVIKYAGNIPAIANSLKIMERNTKRLIDLTTQLLDFRQIELRQLNLSFTRLEITGLLADVYASFTTLAEQKNITMSMRLPEAPFFAFADADAFNKILYNLFSNAVKYAESSIDVALIPGFKSSTTYTVLIKNDGYLIPEDLREKIFEPFFRIREIGSETGTGIGLALARSLTELHNGMLVLEPPEGKMNVFSLTLPVLHQSGSVSDNA